MSTRRPSPSPTISPPTACCARSWKGSCADNGVFRDLPLYVDLLAAHIYAGYINDRGGQYLSADFCGPAADAMAHTRRLLGLDAVDSESGRTRLKLIDGEAYVLGQQPRLSN